MEEEEARFSLRTVNHNSNITGTDKGSKAHDGLTVGLCGLYVSKFNRDSKYYPNKNYVNCVVGIDAPVRNSES